MIQSFQKDYYIGCDAMLADNIRNYRKQFNLSQDELAEKIGVSRQSVSFWENGQTQPTIDNIVTLANVFNVSTDALLDNHQTANVPEPEKPKAAEPGKHEDAKDETRLIVAIYATAILIIIVVILGAIRFFTRTDGSEPDAVGNNGATSSATAVSPAPAEDKFNIFDFFANLGNTVETMEDWSFQYNDGTKDYSLFFALCDDKGKHVTSKVNVNIRIVNSAGETVFEGTRNITEADFGYYSRKDEESQLLANLRIPASEISPGKAVDGTVYFTVYKDGVWQFDECNCEIYRDLPIKDFHIVTENLPAEVTLYSYDGSVQSKFVISSVDCQTDSDILSTAKVIISGVKTYGSGGDVDFIGYKLYDSEGFMVHTGAVSLASLKSGDKFRDDSILLYDIIPGEPYTLEFSSFN